MDKHGHTEPSAKTQKRNEEQQTARDATNFNGVPGKVQGATPVKSLAEEKGDTQPVDEKHTARDSRGGRDSRPEDEKQGKDATRQG